MVWLTQLVVVSAEEVWCVGRRALLLPELLRTILTFSISLLQGVVVKVYLVLLPNNGVGSVVHGDVRERVEVLLAPNLMGLASLQ